jgi:glycosyltransferase involved in cell wall biosynthesis
VKIVVVHNYYRSEAPSGENIVVDREVAALRARGHDVVPFAVRSDDIDDFGVVQRAGIPLGVVWSGGPRRRLSDLVERERPDVVHLHNLFPLISPSALGVPARFGVPLVATVHNYRLMCASGDFYRDGRPCHDCLGRRPLPAVRHGCFRGSVAQTVPVAASMTLHRQSWMRHVTMFLALSAPQRDLLVRAGFPGDRIRVKPNFVPEVSQRSDGSGRSCLYLGRLSPDKGIPLLRDAWTRHDTADPGDELVIAGGGVLEAEVAAWAAVTPSVRFVGRQDRAACEALIARSRSVIVPSSWEETFGLALVEAMAGGVAPIATNHGSFPDLVTDGWDGLLVAPGDPSALAAAIERTRREPDFVALAGKRARATFEARFTEEVVIDQLENAYRDVVATARH